MKLFYIPVFIMGIAGCLNIKRYYKKYAVVKYLMWLIVFSAMPIAVSGLTRIVNYATFALLIVSVLPLIDLDKRLILKMSPPLIFAAMCLVKQYSPYDYSNMLMRFWGLYNDPNYLVMSVMVALFLSIIAFRNSGIINRIFIVGVCCLGLNFLLLSQSRGGLFAVAFMILMGLLELYKIHKKLAITMVCLCVIGSGTYVAANADRIDAFARRIDGMGQETSTQTRITQAQEALKGARSHPEMIALGIGVGKTSEITTPYNKRPDNVLALVYHDKYIIHITPVAIWFEHGFLAFVFYVIVNIVLLKRIIKEHNLFVLGFFLAMTFQSCTIKTTEYLPYWEAIALCINIKTLLELKVSAKHNKKRMAGYENTSYCMGIIRS